MNRSPLQTQQQLQRMVPSKKCVSRDDPARKNLAVKGGKSLTGGPVKAVKRAGATPDRPTRAAKMAAPSPDRSVPAVQKVAVLKQVAPPFNRVTATRKTVGVLKGKVRPAVAGVGGPAVQHRRKKNGRHWLVSDVLHSHSHTHSRCPGPFRNQAIAEADLPAHAPPSFLPPGEGARAECRQWGALQPSRVAIQRQCCLQVGPTLSHP